MKKILLLDAFHTGSHKTWANGLLVHSKHEIEILTLPGRNWKWRMHGAAVYFAEQISKLKYKPDIILATDMLDLSILMARTRKTLPDASFYIYFHENQINYPWSPEDADVKLNRDYHYAFINYVSALCADKVFFNSNYHRNAFLEGAVDALSHFPDYNLTESVSEIEKKSSVLPLGMELKKNASAVLQAYDAPKVPTILWNHRWEFDKNPDGFFKALFRLQEEGIPFKLNVVGESYSKSPAIFEEAKTRLRKQISHFGYAASSTAYFQILEESDITLVTSFQDFFGGSVVEAIYHSCLPLLPKRLASPEHIPDDLKELFLYENEEELYEKLKKMLLDLTAYSRFTDRLKSHIAKYDWNVLIKLYDEKLGR